MPFQLVALDVDGTILDSRGELSSRTEKAIGDLCRRGVKVILATGRRFIDTAHLARRLGLELPVISHNGAMIFSMETADILYHRSIATDKLLPFLENKQNNLDFYLQSGDKILLPREPTQKWSKKYLAENKTYVCPFKDCGCEDNPIHRLVVTGSPVDIKGFTMRMQDHLDQVHHITFTSYYYDMVFLELLERGVSKGNALKYLAEYWCIPREQIMAVGDETNDIEMVRWAGLGVAMGNGLPELKEQADLVCSANDQDGLAELLERTFAGGHFVRGL